MQGVANNGHGTHSDRYISSDGIAGYNKDGLLKIAFRGERSKIMQQQFYGWPLKCLMAC